MYICRSNFSGFPSPITRCQLFQDLRIPGFFLSLLFQETIYSWAVLYGSHYTDVLFKLKNSVFYSTDHILSAQQAFESMATILDNSFVENFHLHACMLSCSVQLSCPALCNPMDCSLPGSSRQEYGSGLPFPSSRDLPNPGIEPTSPALAGRFFTTEPLGNPTYPYHK